MARVDIPLPGRDKDYQSRKSRAQLINLMVQVNDDGSFKSITKREGVELLATNPNNDNIASNLYVGSDGLIYYVGADNFYRINSTGTITDLGVHGFTALSPWKVISNNSTPDPQYMFYHSAGSGEAAIYDTTITAVTDTDYTAKLPVGGTMLYGRFYFVNSTVDTEFFASDLLDGFAYDPLAIADADEEAGRLLDNKSYKSAMWLFKTRNIEYWQTADDPTFPLRRVLGSSLKVGIDEAAIGNGVVDQLYDTIGFLGSDKRVYLMEGSSASVISDIDFAQKFQDETKVFINPYVFFVDGPDHRYLCVTSTFISHPANFNEFTWVYDLKTRQSHYRTSASLDYWAFTFGAYSQAGTKDTVITYPMLFQTDFDRDSLFELTPNVFTDDGTDFECILQSGSLSFGHDSIIEYIEVEMETGVGNADSADPEMTVKFSKDGGENFFTWGTVKLGGSTDKSKRVRMNNFGRLVRHTDFVLQLSITEPVRVEFYGAYAEITGGF